MKRIVPINDICRHDISSCKKMSGRHFSLDRPQTSRMEEQMEKPYAAKGQVPSFLRSNSERRAADHIVRVNNDQLTVKISRNSDEHAFLVARAAVIGGDTAYLKKLICKDRTLIDASDHFGRTLLIYAALSGQTDCVQWLISEGANVRAKDRDGMTVVHWTVHKGQHRTLKTLLKKPANGDPLTADEEGTTPLHLAVKQPSSKCLDVIVDYLVRRDNLGAVVSIVDKGGRSAVHWAAAAGRLPELLKHLKEKLKLTFEESDLEGRTPLMWSVLSESSSLACIDLITQRAPRSVRAQDAEGNTALHLSVMVDNIAAIERLLECKLINPNQTDTEGRTALHWAGILGRPGAAALLLKCKADIGRKDDHGATAMHYAAQCNSVETLKMMLRHCAEEPVDDEGRTCFMWAAGSGSVDAMMTVLNSLKTVDVEQKDKCGSTALHFAARNGQDTSVKFLLDRGWQANSLDYQGQTALLIAAEHGHASTLQCLLKAGAAAWHKDSNGRTALHWAALGGHAYVCQILIKQGLSVDAMDIGGRTAVHCAAFGGFVGCVSVLLQAGAHPCIPDHQGMIALHLAASEGHLDVCKRLLDSGSLINAIYEDEDRRLTPLDLASANEKKQVVDYLLENGAMSFDRLIDVAATKVQAFYKGYMVRKRLKNKTKESGTSPTRNNVQIHRYIKKKLASH